MATIPSLLYASREYDADISVWINDDYLCTLRENEDSCRGAITDDSGSFLLRWVVDNNELLHLTCYTDEAGKSYDLREDPEVMDWYPEVVRRFHDQIPLIVKQQLSCATNEE